MYDDPKPDDTLVMNVGDFNKLLKERDQRERALIGVLTGSLFVKYGWSTKLKTYGYWASYQGKTAGPLPSAAQAVIAVLEEAEMCENPDPWTPRWSPAPHASETYSRTIIGEAAALEAADKIIRAGHLMWFAITPAPDDTWLITVRRANGTRLDALLEPPVVRTPEAIIELYRRLVGQFRIAKRLDAPMCEWLQDQLSLEIGQ